MPLALAFLYTILLIRRIITTITVTNVLHLSLGKQLRDQLSDFMEGGLFWS